MPSRTSRGTVPFVTDGISNNAAFTTKPTLQGDLVTLRPICGEDADAIDRIIHDDDEIGRLTGSVNSSDEKPMGMPIGQLREIYAG
jgi:hypothetical protein